MAEGIDGRGHNTGGWWNGSSTQRGTPEIRTVESGEIECEV